MIHRAERDIFRALLYYIKLYIGLDCRILSGTRGQLYERIRRNVIGRSEFAEVSRRRAARARSAVRERRRFRRHKTFVVYAHRARRLYAPQYLGVDVVAVYDDIGINNVAVADRRRKHLVAVLVRAGEQRRRYRADLYDLAVVLFDIGLEHIHYQECHGERKQNAHSHHHYDELGLALFYRFELDYLVGNRHGMTPLRFITVISYIKTHFLSIAKRIKYVLFYV